MTHDDQLTRLLATLKGPRGADAVAELRSRYRVVLIDEFQDTDPIQWEIVERAFGGMPPASGPAGHETTLVLIGDPKQAIYAFRGADVYAYLAAAAERRRARHAGRQPPQRQAAARRPRRAVRPGPARPSRDRLPARRRAPRSTSAPRLHGAPGEGALRVRLLDPDEPSVVRTPSGYPNAESARAFVARDLAADIVALLNSEAAIELRDEEGEAIGSRRDRARLRGGAGAHAPQRLR